MENKLLVEVLFYEAAHQQSLTFQSQNGDQFSCQN